MDELITRKETILLKGLAISMVIVEHIGQAFHIGIVNPLGPIGVFLFLFLSGYGIECSYKKNGRKKYFIKKVIKVYLPYILAVGLFVIWCFYIGEKIFVSDILKWCFLVLLPQGSFWFLILLFYWYVIYFFLTFVENKKVLYIVLMVIASVTIIWVQDFQRGYVWQFFSFPLGVLVGKKLRINIKKINVKFVSLLLLVLALIFVFLKKTPYVEQHELGVFDTFLQLGITLAIGIVILINRKNFFKIPIISKVLSLIGKVSYELYLAHVIPLDNLKFNPTPLYLIRYIIVCLICVLIIVFFNKVVKCVKSNKVKLDKNSTK